jgi:hypothetical protein
MLKDLLQLPQIIKAIIHKGDDQGTKLRYMTKKRV